MRTTAVLLACVACSGDDGKGTTPTGEQSWPADSSAAGITAFLDGESWRASPWVSETDAPRDANSAVSPHGRVRVWGNEVLVESQAAGNGDFGGAAHPSGAMAIKELFDEADAPTGTAVMLKVDGDAFEWAYYCDGPAAQCGISGPTDPAWDVGTASECSFCHGGLVFNQL